MMRAEMTRFGLAVLSAGVLADALAHLLLPDLGSTAHLVTLVGMLLVLGDVIFRAYHPNRRG